MRSLCFLALLVVLTGCASEIQKRNAERFTLIGMQAQAQGDWDTARRAYARAVVNGEQAKLPQRTLAVLTYEYGRSLGVSCFFDLAEAELNRAYELDRQAGNPLYLSLTELARLTFDQQKFQVAASYFARAIEKMDQGKVVETAPTAYADILAEYAIALAKVDRVTEAVDVNKRVSAIRKANPDGKSVTDRTPYGKFCASPK